MRQPAVVVRMCVLGTLGFLCPVGISSAADVFESAPGPAISAPQSEAAPQPCRFSEWASAAEYQVIFDRNLKDRVYPEKVEGRSYSSIRQYRGCFRPFHANRDFSFESRSGMSAADFQQRDRDLQARGYSLRYRQGFEDSAGTSIQATWTIHE
jgi:hypothetical protein